MSPILMYICRSPSKEQDQGSQNSLGEVSGSSSDIAEVVEEMSFSGSQAELDGSMSDLQNSADASGTEAESDGNYSTDFVEESISSAGSGADVSPVSAFVLYSQLYNAPHRNK